MHFIELCVLCCAVCRRSCGTNALCLACVYVVCVQVASITPFSRYLPSHHTTHFSGCNGAKALPQLFNPNPSAQPLTHSLFILSILNYLLLSLTHSLSFQFNSFSFSVSFSPSYNHPRSHVTSFSPCHLSLPLIPTSRCNSHARSRVYGRPVRSVQEENDARIPIQAKSVK
jgi:hypothetical protein